MNKLIYDITAFQNDPKPVLWIVKNNKLYNTKNPLEALSLPISIINNDKEILIYE